MEHTLQNLESVASQVCPLKELKVKIMGFQLTFTEILDSLTSYAKHIEVETNAKNDLTFRSMKNGDYR